MQQAFRRISDYERSILDRMLSYEFEGKKEIEQQLTNAKARVFDSGDNYGSIEISVDPDAILANVTERVSIELEAHDKDGIPVAVLLHIVDGKAEELELIQG